jgi:hypothetical protein
MNVHARIAQALETSLSTTPTRFMKAWMEPGLERISPNLFEFATLKRKSGWASAPAENGPKGRPRHQRRPSAAAPRPTSIRAWRPSCGFQPSGRSIEHHGFLVGAFKGVPVDPVGYRAGGDPFLDRVLD